MRRDLRQLTTTTLERTTVDVVDGLDRVGLDVAHHLVDAQLDRDVVDEVDEGGDAGGRQDQPAGDRELRHEVLVGRRAVADDAQHREAVGERREEHREHDLVGWVTHERAQQAGENWLEASWSVTTVSENTTPVTVMTEPATASRTPRAPSAPPP